MLVLARKECESVWIGDDIKVSIVRIGESSVRIGIEAPEELNIARHKPPRLVKGMLGKCDSGGNPD